MFKGLRKAGVAATVLHAYPGNTSITHTVPSLEKLKYCGILSKSFAFQLTEKVEK